MTKSLRPLAEHIARRILAKELADLRTANDWLRKHADRLETAVAESEAELARLRQRAGRQDPTPTEAQYLQIVADHPGITAPQAGVEHWRRHSINRGLVEPPPYAHTYATAPLRALMLKGYVRREPTTGGTFRYWPAGGGAA